MFYKLIKRVNCNYAILAKEIENYSAAMLVCAEALNSIHCVLV